MERCESGLCSRYFWQIALRFISSQVLKVMCEGVGRNCFLKEGLSDGLSYFTSQKSKETRGNTITHPHSYPLAPGHFLNDYDFLILHITTHLHLLQLCFKLLQSDGGWHERNHDSFSSPSQSLNSLYSDL